ncbi:MAG: hypothetical protein KA260_09085 [Burkholderiales bacterium]|nr:hypothetical protein [Burkholderiales bacterium]
MSPYTLSQWSAKTWAAFFASFPTFFVTGNVISTLVDGPRGIAFSKYLWLLIEDFVDAEASSVFLGRVIFLLMAIVGPLALGGYLSLVTNQISVASALFLLVASVAVLCLISGALLFAVVFGVIGAFGYSHLLDLKVVRSRHAA